MSNTINFTYQKIIEVTHYSSKLIKFSITRPQEYNFNAGQFSRLGFEDGEGFIWRAYSIMSAEYDSYLSYLAVLVEGGKMSQRIKNIKVEDIILLDKTAVGFLLPYRFEGGKNLVMLATGSGVAPFISQLQNENLWQRFNKIYLIHSVSYIQDLVSKDIINSFADHLLIGDYIKSNQFKFIPIVTRGKDSNFLNKRIPILIENKSLYKLIDNFNTKDTKIMICGNPSMVQESFKQLLKLGFTMHRNNIPGNIIMENGF